MTHTWLLGSIQVAGGMPFVFGQSGGDIDFIRLRSYRSLPATTPP